MRGAWLVMWLLLAAILLFATAPLISVAIAGMIAEANGCTLHEGFVNPCIVGGVDWGSTLYALGVMGWFMLATIPIGAIALAAWLVAAVVLLVIGYRRRRAAPPAP